MEITPILSLIALVFQGILVYLAWQAIKSNAATARKRAIVDLLIKQREDKALSTAFRRLYDLRKAHTPLSSMREDEEFRTIILPALDTLEFIAVGIRLGAFDEEVYKELQCSKIINTWKSAEGLVAELRNETNLPTLYQDLEHLANRWNADPIRELKKDTYKGIS